MFAVANNVVNVVRRFASDESGLTMVEYAVAGALITIAAILAFTALGTNVAARIQEIADVLA